MALKNILTLTNQDKLKKIEDDLTKQFVAIYRTYGVLANKLYKANSDLVIKELKAGQYEFFNYADLLIKELRLSTIYDLCNLLNIDLIPNNANRIIFIRGLGSALFYQRVLHQLVGINEDIIWSAYTNMHPLIQEILPKLATDYTVHLEKEDPALVNFQNSMHRSFDESIHFLANRTKFVKFKSW